MGEAWAFCIMRKLFSIWKWKMKVEVWKEAFTQWQELGMKGRHCYKIAFHSTIAISTISSIMILYFPLIYGLVFICLYIYRSHITHKRKVFSFKTVTIVIGRGYEESLLLKIFVEKESQKSYEACFVKL